jgi:hypothetical protein
MERRRAPRSAAGVYFNKHVDGHAFLAQAVELSATGMLARRVSEPEGERSAYAVELALPGAPASERVWTVASPVWRKGDIEALVFVETSDEDKALLDSLAERFARRDPLGSR